MDVEKAKTLLESLFGRIERDGKDSHWRLSGPVSSLERAALRFVLKNLGVEIPPEADEERPKAPAVLPQIRLNTHAAALRSAEEPEVVMCVDFGTAMSKAFAIHAEDEQPVDLALGRRAGYTEA